MWCLQQDAPLFSPDVLGSLTALTGLQKLTHTSRGGLQQNALPLDTALLSCLNAWQDLSSLLLDHVLLDTACLQALAGLTALTELRVKGFKEAAPPPVSLPVLQKLIFWGDVTVWQLSALTCPQLSKLILDRKTAAISLERCDDAETAQLAALTAPGALLTHAPVVTFSPTAAAMELQGSEECVFLPAEATARWVTALGTLPPQCIITIERCEVDASVALILPASTYIVIG